MMRIFIDASPDPLDRANEHHYHECQPAAQGQCRDRRQNQFATNNDDHGLLVLPPATGLSSLFLGSVKSCPLKYQ